MIPSRPRSGLGVLLLLAGVFALPLSSQQGGPSPFERSPLHVRVEGGAFWQARNDVQIPGDTGTRFDLLELVGTDASGFARVHFDWQVAPRHGLRLVYAPVRASGTGQLNQSVDFDGVSFAAGTARGRYRFDTYRLTWRYLAWNAPAWRWNIGLTALVRDAAITLEQPGLFARKSNTGVVPLLHIDSRWAFAPGWDAAGDLDVAAAAQGRAIDLSLELGHQFAANWRASIGYRTIEGGADNDEVFSFAWLHAATFAVTYGF